MALEDRVIDLAFNVNVEFGVYISPRASLPGSLNHPVWGANTVQQSRDPGRPDVLLDSFSYCADGYDVR